MRVAIGPRRAAALVAAAALLVALPPIADDPARAAIRRRLVVDCRQPDTCWPAAFTFTPNGRQIYYAERFTGQIRVFNRNTGSDKLWRGLGGVATQGEQGVLGIALDPDWPADGWVYVYYTKNGNPDRNLIVRMRKRAGGGFRTQRLLRIPAANIHNGGVIHFGPDDKLWAVTGDASNPARSQKKRNPAGKVLRMNQNGSRPGNNPFRGVAYSYGHRNSFGFDFDPRTGRVWQTENGPQCDDEINRILKGKNYGWGPSSACPNTSESGPGPKQPKKVFNPPIAPTGAAFCQRCGLGRKARGDLIFGAFNDGKIRRLQLTNRRKGAGAVAVIFNHPRGILAVEAAPRPDRHIYFSDSRGIYQLRR